MGVAGNFQVEHFMHVSLFRIGANFLDLYEEIGCVKSIMAFLSPFC